MSLQVAVMLHSLSWFSSLLRPTRHHSSLDPRDAHYKCMACLLACLRTLTAQTCSWLASWLVPFQQKTQTHGTWETKSLCLQSSVLVCTACTAAEFHPGMLRSFYTIRSALSSADHPSSAVAAFRFLGATTTLHLLLLHGSSEFSNRCSSFDHVRPH